MQQMPSSKKEFLETNTCTKCDKGYIFQNKSMTKCSCFRDWQKKHRLVQYVKMSGLKAKDLGYDISTYYGDKKLPKAIDAFVEGFVSNKTNVRSTNIFFTGIVNTQKSTIARYIGVSLIKSGFTVKYLLMDDLIKMLQDTASHNASAKEGALELRDELTKVDLLILDESFDSERITLYKSNYQIPYLTSFLKNRLEVEAKSNIFISNKKPTDIADEGFSEALQSLVQRECLTLEFKDSLDKINAVSTKDFADIFS